MRTCTTVKRILRGIRFSIALKEESYAFLVWSVRVESWHNHDLPWQIPYKAGRTENWLAQSVEAFDCELKCCFWSPTCVCNTHTYTQDYLKNLMFFTPICHFSKIMQHWKWQKKKNKPRPWEALNSSATEVSIFSFWETLQQHSGKQSTGRCILFVHCLLK